MKINQTQQTLEVSYGAVDSVRIISGVISFFLLFRLVRYTYLSFVIMVEWNSPLYLVFNGHFFLLLVLLCIAAYISSNSRKYIFNREGITSYFGPRLYAGFSIKKEFFPAEDINSLIVIRYRARVRGLPMYGLHAGRKSKKKVIDLFGDYDKDKIFLLAEDIRKKLERPEISIIDALSGIKK